MTTFADSLKKEIARVARKELRDELGALRKTALQQRSEIAALKKQIKALQAQMVTLGRARAEGAETLDRLERFVSEDPRLSWHRPEAGLIGLARVEGTDGESLARALLAPPWRTFLLPGSAYGLPQHIRIGAGGGPEARLEEGLGRLSALLRSGMI